MSQILYSMEPAFFAASCRRTEAVIEIFDTGELLRLMQMAPEKRLDLWGHPGAKKLLNIMIGAKMGPNKEPKKAAKSQPQSYLSVGFKRLYLARCGSTWLF
ncbi:hypothetical protein [Aeromonas jandaei]|uniref:hypothetical protein n=1 Tax=Aeromonas jandaei TaxID=650 RepID=UPI003BA3C5F2